MSEQPVVVRSGGGESSEWALHRLASVHLCPSANETIFICSCWDLKSKLGLNLFTFWTDSVFLTCRPAAWWTFSDLSVIFYLPWRSCPVQTRSKRNIIKKINMSIMNHLYTRLSSMSNNWLSDVRVGLLMALKRCVWVQFPVAGTIMFSPQSTWNGTKSCCVFRWRGYRLIGIFSTWLNAESRGRD